MGNQTPSGCCANANAVCLCKETCASVSSASEKVRRSVAFEHRTEDLVEFELIPYAEGKVLEGSDIVSPVVKPLRLLPGRGLSERRYASRGSAATPELRRQPARQAMPPSPGDSEAGDAHLGSSTPLVRSRRLGSSDRLPASTGDQLLEVEMFKDATFAGEDGGDEWHGAGVLTWPDGRVYAGQFSHGTLDGEATMTWPDGRTYAGTYQCNKKHGEGVFMWPDGRRYVGQWEAGLRHGWGLYTNAKGDGRVGHWTKDQPIAWEPAGAAATGEAPPSVSEAPGGGRHCAEDSAEHDHLRPYAAPRSIARAGGA